ncbi:SIS domain-containing protein [Breznakiella homolactica]|uniref:Glutamine--fructose-6-phosphate aminotransferase [isomerizing] n=1 Tax=Breznakiella homolactica TaxID=2798577 RepID=A0A7T8B8T2_9SPIR|nr:SIS domain-containing protein [Breznakiella homolactica]QQO07712.1 SIS domain-containing protein [Breznakiella homolactica]
MDVTIAEKNGNLRKHMLSMSDPKSWEKTIALTGESLKEFENAPFLKGTKQVFIIGQGTSYATSLLIETFFEHIADIRASAYPAFHFAAYAGDYIKAPEETLVIGVSCSGNTASVSAGLREAKEQGAKTLAISNEGDIDNAKFAEYRIKTDALLERAAQVTAYSVSHLFIALAGYELAVLMGSRNGALDAGNVRYWKDQFTAAQSAMSVLPALFDRMKEISAEFSQSRNACVLGTGPNFGTMKEGALKISEFTWLFCAGEELEDFAHGRFRESDGTLPLLIIAPEGPSVAKTMDLLAACVISGTPSIVFTDVPTPALRKMATHTVEMPKLENEYLTPFLYIFPLWFYGWHIRNNAGYAVAEKRHGLAARDINFKLHFDEEGNRK